MLNFWATWCPPCRKEMPDLEALFQLASRVKGWWFSPCPTKTPCTVKPFIADRKITYPILLDPAGRSTFLFNVVGIPKTFIYDRAGKLVAESIDMRTRSQFLDLLAQVGLHDR